VLLLSAMSGSHTPYGSVPDPSDSHLNRGYGTSTGVNDFAQANPSSASPLSQSAQQQHGAFHEDFDASQRGSFVTDDGNAGVNRSVSILLSVTLALRHALTLVPSAT